MVSSTYQLLALAPLVHSQLLARSDPHTSIVFLTSNTYSDDIVGTPTSTITPSGTFVTDAPEDSTSDSSFLHPTAIGPGIASIPTDTGIFTDSTTTIGAQGSSHAQSISVTDSTDTAPIISGTGLGTYTTGITGGSTDASATATTTSNQSDISGTDINTDTTGITGGSTTTTGVATTTGSSTVGTTALTGVASPSSTGTNGGGANRGEDWIGTYGVAVLGFVAGLMFS